MRPPPPCCRRTYHALVFIENCKLQSANNKRTVPSKSVGPQSNSPFISPLHNAPPRQIDGATCELLRHLCRRVVVCAKLGGSPEEIVRRRRRRRRLGVLAGQWAAARPEARGQGQVDRQPPRFAPPRLYLSPPDGVDAVHRPSSFSPDPSAAKTDACSWTRPCWCGDGDSMC